MAQTALSPGVNFTEIDLTGIIPSLGSSTGATVGNFQWGPINKVIEVQDEIELGRIFFTPDANTYLDFMVASQFLIYTSGLDVVRTANTAAVKNAVVTSTLQILNEDYWDVNYIHGSGGVGEWAARYPGGLGNNIKVVSCVGANAWSTQMIATCTTTANSNTILFSANTKTDAARPLSIGDIVTIGAFANTGLTGLLVTGIDASGMNVSVNTAVTISLVANTVVGSWAYTSHFAGPPGTSDYATSVGGSGDEIHVAVIDTTGVISGFPNSILEIYPYLSVGSDARNSDGSTNYYRDVLRGKSHWIYWMANDPLGTNWSNTCVGTTFTNVNRPTYRQLTGGITAAANDGNRCSSWNLFTNTESIEIDLVIAGAVSPTVQNYILDNVVLKRLDCVLFVSPQITDVVNQFMSEAENCVLSRQNLPSSSYGFMDGNWKLAFDRYNNLYRWLPLCGDIAGLAARTDSTNDPWWSFAGLNRGNILNVTKLAWTPNKIDRNILYSAGINPVLAFKNEGPVLFGDKTLQAKPSAFDRINVRRLFLVLERAIAAASRYSLFEFNDDFTRAQFINMVDPYLRTIKGRRGIIAYDIVCDNTNNTPFVISSNQFVADIYIQANRVINYIQLNFVNSPLGVDFSEIIGKWE